MKPKRPVVSDALETPDAWQCGRLDMPENDYSLRRKPGVKMTYSKSELAETEITSGIGSSISRGRLADILNSPYLPAWSIKIMFYTHDHPQ